MPNIVKDYWEKNFDKTIMKELGNMGFLGCTLNSHGGSGLNYISYGLINWEIERVDSSYRSALSV